MSSTAADGLTGATTRQGASIEKRSGIHLCRLFDKLWSLFPRFLFLSLPSPDCHCRAGSSRLAPFLWRARFFFRIHHRNYSCPIYTYDRAHAHHVRPRNFRIWKIIRTEATRDLFPWHANFVSINHCVMCVSLCLEKWRIIVGTFRLFYGSAIYFLGIRITVHFVKARSSRKSSRGDFQRNICFVLI